MSFRFAEVEFNGRPLHLPGSGWEQGEPVGAPDGAPYREVLSEVGGTHFGTVSRGSYGFGSLIVPVKVRGDTQLAFDVARQRLARTCAGYGNIRARVAGGSWVTARAVAQAPFSVGRSVGKGTEYLVGFTLASFWTTETDMTQSWTITSASQIIDLTNWANATAPMTEWIVEIRGTFTNPEVSPSAPAGAPNLLHSMIYKVTLASLAVATITTKAGALTIVGSAGHTADYSKLVHPASPYPLEITPGGADDAPQIRMKSTGSSFTNSRLTLTGPISYLGV